MKLQAFFRRLPPPLRRHKIVQALISLCPPLAYQEVEFNGSGRLIADLRDANARTYFLRGSFEPEYFEIATAFLSEGGVMFDIGANFGFSSFGLLGVAAGRGPACHLFEANPHLCDLLRRSAKLAPMPVPIVNHCCVSDEVGVSRLNIMPNDWGQSFIGAEGTIAVPNLRLDDYAARHGITSVPFTKMDIEGFEPYALRGAAELLRTGALSAIYLEVSAPALARQGFSPADSCRLLTEAGYRIFFCKERDLVRFSVSKLRLKGRTLPVVECSGFDFPPDYQTDLLALHRSSPWLASLSS